MEVIPAIDLMDGRCVQLVGGDPNTKKDYGDPVGRGVGWKEKGARTLHVVDLDAALERGSNLNILTDLKRQTRLTLEFGGGIRTEEKMMELLRLDIDRIIIGTLALKDFTNDFEILKSVNDEFGEKRVMVALDTKEGHVTIKGWTEKTSLKAVDLIEASEEYVWGYLYTDVDAEGKMMGVDEGRFKEVLNATDKPVILSGGVSSREDIDFCRDAGAWGVVVGKALYEGKVTLE
ncbi:MAG: 1-(5-phosphoribosyl)-5-((5-phosphoribosylamino)methylideneamino)imidazole-4-carboxamide isomerase [Candidatus Altiarchaeales archaeon]|nr:1-(5-phosphoribosyl)-5-((5-phosphoribosylamino)methylideneamino)imidazole-4-carboxamide isomerase [Candidatus Altiarchaeales archaeon]MBD3417200.1 1-(5-phosphoribosyl)-5-((5-phosphoribosylamino)methylideneamino)imidazole-4-carboxamide isomerase [Candidatus Altiarchaeales archaeon]